MKTLRNYTLVTLLLIVFLSVSIPLRYQTEYPMDVGPQFDNRIRTVFTDYLNEQQPEILLLGDSMLAPAVDQDILAVDLERKTSMISLPGTASTIWYLIIKNNIVRAEHKPAYLVVFFRDTMMTLPGYRVTGRYFEQVDEFASPDDTLLIERAYLNQMTALEKFMERYMPLYGSRWRIRESIDYHIRYTLGNALLECNPACMDRAMEVVFQESNLDVTFLSDAIGAADEYIYTPEALDFEGSIDRSFLPEVIRLCRENGIQLVLVRMPIDRFYAEKSQPRGLTAYIESMTGYLGRNNIPFLDFDRKEMPAGYFADTLHLNEAGRVEFTRQLAESLGRVIK